MKKRDKTLQEVTEITKNKEIQSRLILFDGNRKKTAESLGITRQQLQILIKKYEITIPPPIRYRSRAWITKSIS